MGASATPEGSYGLYDFVKRKTLTLSQLMQKLMCFSAFYINTLGFYIPYRFLGGCYSPLNSSLPLLKLETITPCIDTYVAIASALKHRIKYHFYKQKHPIATF